MKSCIEIILLTAKLQSIMITGQKSEEFQVRAQNLMAKLTTLMSDRQNQQAEKHQEALRQMLEIENNLKEKHATKKNAYKTLLSKINTLSQQIQSETTKQQKKKLILNNQIEKASQKFEIIFQKLRHEREDHQQQIETYLNQKINWLVNRNKICVDSNNRLRIANPANDLGIDQQLQQLSEIRKQIGYFFKGAQIEEQQFKKQMYQSFAQYRQQLQSENWRAMLYETRLYLEEVHQQISYRIHKMKNKRQQTQQETLDLLQNIFSAIKDKERGKRFKTTYDR